MPKTIVQVSDTHLCKVFPYFADNWQHFAAEMEALKPDHLIHTGDISLSGTMDDQAMRHIRNEIDRLPVPCFAIPGNHVGQHHFEYGPELLEPLFVMSIILSMVFF